MSRSAADREINGPDGDLRTATGSLSAWFITDKMGKLGYTQGRIMQVLATDWIEVIGSDGYTYQVIEYSECADTDGNSRSLSQSEHSGKHFQLLTGHGVDSVDENTWRIRDSSITLRRIHPT
jgi:hypothetical protein